MVLAMELFIKQFNIFSIKIKAAVKNPQNINYLKMHLCKCKNYLSFHPKFNQME
jgi:hypothetical protein